MAEAYAVFEGGGVKGIALVGALARVQKESIQFKGFAGTSAGAIVAALAALGYPAQVDDHTKLIERERGGRALDIKTIMDDLKLERFLDGTDAVELRDIFELSEIFRPVATSIVDDVRQFWNAGWWRRWKLWRQFRTKYARQVESLPKLQRVVHRLTSHKGIYRTHTFCEWLDNVLKGKAPAGPDGEVTFGAMSEAGCPLKVVATDLRKREPRVYDAKHYGGTKVADAVRASMSIPFFFCPVGEGDNFLVDGGLLSNFPAWVFDEERKAAGGDIPVLGFRLVPEEDAPTHEVKSTVVPFGQFWEFAGGVFTALTEGTDILQTREVPSLVTIEIKVPKSITATRFDLTDGERRELFERGYLQAHKELSKPENRVKLKLA